MGLNRLAVVTSTTGKGVNVLGGMIAPGEYSKASMQWTKLDNSPTGKGVIVTGGITEKDSKAIFELSQLIQWTRLVILLLLLSQFQMS